MSLKFVVVEMKGGRPVYVYGAFHDMSAAATWALKAEDRSCNSFVVQPLSTIPGAAYNG